LGCKKAQAKERAFAGKLWVAALQGATAVKDRWSGKLNRFAERRPPFSGTSSADGKTYKRKYRGC